MRTAADGSGTHTLQWPVLTAAGPLTAVARECVKSYLADKLTKKKTSTVVNDFSMFLRFAKWLSRQRYRTFGWDRVTESIARGFLAAGLQTADKGNDFSRLRTFYRWGVAREVTGFDPAILNALETVTAVGNAMGHSVRFRDVFRGPFSPDELLLIRTAILNGAGTEQDRVIVMLHLELGHNPVATTRLKNRDLHRIETGGQVFFHLDVPRVKKRSPRRETKRRPISAKLGELVERLRQGEGDGPLFPWLGGDGRQAMVRFSLAANLVSPRTGKRLVINARRFRFSLATYMAEEGSSLFHIAEVLDHTDTQNVRVYVETASSIADPVARATDSALGPLVRRFQGRIAEIAPPPSGGLIPASAPHLGIEHLDVGGVGFCGRDAHREGPCRLLPPVSCYLCPSFAALRDGPHAQILKSIDGFLARGSETNDPRILTQLEDVRYGITELLASLDDRQQGVAS